MWQVLLREAVLAHNFVDGRITGATVVGNNITGGYDNTQSIIVLNPPIITSSGGANAFIGDDVEFYTGVNAGLRRKITGVDYSSGQVNKFYFGGDGEESWPAIPQRGDTYHIWFWDSITYTDEGVTRFVGGNISNGFDHFLINPYITTSYANALNYIGRTVIFAHWGNYSLGDQISGLIYNPSSGQLEGFKFAAEFAEIPAPNTMFHMYYHDGSFGASTLYSQTVQFRQEIDNITFETDIEVGYSKCSVTLNQYSERMGHIYQNLPGMIMDVIDPWGHTAYFGLVYSASIEGTRATINAMSLMDTNAWYHTGELVFKNDINVPNDPDNPANIYVTAPRIIRQLLQLNPFIDISPSNETCIVPDSAFSWNTIQNQNLGIGERSYEANNFTIKDILDEILAMGYYFMDNISGKDLSGDKVVVQIWNHGTPRVNHITKKPALSDVNYFITNKNFKYEFEGMSLEADLSEAESAVIGAYNDSQGESQNTVTNFNIDLLRHLGPKSVIFTSSEDSKGGVSAATKAHKQDKSLISGPGSIVISGLVKSGNGGHASIPVWKIHAGDIVAFEANVASTNIFRSDNSSPGIFVVGSTRYDVGSDSMTLTAYRPAKYRDMYDARLKI